MSRQNTLENTPENTPQGKGKTGIFPESRESRENTRGFPSLKTAFPRETGKQLGVSLGKGNPVLKYKCFPSSEMGSDRKRGGTATPPFALPYPSHGRTKTRGGTDEI